MSLLDLGWTAQRHRDFAAHTDAGLLPGRIVGEHRTHYEVATTVGELIAECSGRLRNAAALRSDLPGVGDFVALRPAAGDGPATIEAVLARSSALIRKASGKETPQLLAANVDVVFIVTGLDGDFNLARIVRFLALVRDSGATPVIVANKTDLTTDIEAISASIAEAAPGAALHAVSARTGQSVPALEAYLANSQTVALIGSSGAGKSTLINRLLGRDAQATGEVRGHDSRGRHTTTHRQLFLRPAGGAIIDTPGMRGLEAWQPAEPTAPDFADIEALATGCKFRDCRHQTEPGCAVQAAIGRGEFDAGRLAAYPRRNRG